MTRPEERIRENLIGRMVRFFGFPKGLISVERCLSSLPHLQGKRVSQRRFDIICFANLQSLFCPLLMIECKAISLSQGALEQVLGYNHYVGAFFVAIANEDQCILTDKEAKYFSNDLLPYQQLVYEAKRFTMA